MGAIPKNIWAGLKSQGQVGIINIGGSGTPISGSSAPRGFLVTGAGAAGKGSLYKDSLTGNVYVNEGTAAAPYWTPQNWTQPMLLAWRSDWRDGLGKALADTGATATIAGSGIRVFGQGIDETDSGFVVTVGEDGGVGRLTTTDEAAHVAALGVGITTSVPFQPDRHGAIVVEALISCATAITLRSLGLGFIGTAADALDPPATGSGTTITLVQDDLALLFQSVGLTATSRFFGPHNKSDEAATIATTNIDTGVNLAAAGTYQLLRVEISAAGVMTCFIDKVQVLQITAALDVDEEVAPVFYVASTSAAVKSVDVKYFAAWGNRAGSLL